MTEPERPFEWRSRKWRKKYLQSLERLMNVDQKKNNPQDGPDLRLNERLHMELGEVKKIPIV